MTGVQTCALPICLFDLYEIVPGFLGNLAVAWAVSRTGRPDGRVAAEFDAAADAARP